MRQFLFSLLILTTIILPSESYGRTWTDKEGRSFEGELVKYDDERVLVKRYSDKQVFHIKRSALSAADNEYIEKKKLEALVTEFAHYSYDKVEGITWYEPGGDAHSTGIMHNRSYQTYTTLYIGVPDEGKPFMRWRLQYCGKGWLFIDKYKIKIDNADAITLTPPKDLKTTVAGGGNVREVFDERADPYSDIINQIIHAEDVVIRMQGSRGYLDFTPRRQSIDEFKKMIRLYNYLGGEWPTKGGE